MTNIPKILYLIWLGNAIPTYVENVLMLYKTYNPHFTIEFIHFSLHDIAETYNNKCDLKYSDILKQSMQYLIDKDNKYHDFISEQVHVYGKNIRAIQILSDIFRLELVNTYGGIYVDCDTVPLRSFDDKLLSYNKFTVTRHYDTGYLYKTNIEYIDNYFIGSNGQKNGQITNLINDVNLISLLQTDKNWYSNVFYKYRKSMFYKNKLTIEMLQNLNSPFYIEHYHDNNWKQIKNKKIRTPICCLDKFLTI